MNISKKIFLATEFSDLINFDVFIFEKSQIYKFDFFIFRNSFYANLHLNSRFDIIFLARVKI